MKKSMGWLIAAAVAAQVSAAEPPSIDRLVDCAAIGSAQERLACFDREVTAFARVRSQAVTPGSVPPAQSAARATPPAPPAPPAAAAAPPAASAASSGSASASFGGESLSSKSKKDNQAPESMRARVERIRPAGTGVYLVYLDNGQTWRHEDEVNGAYLHEGDAITITKATLGAYRLTRDAGNGKNWIRVSRVR
jgi:hypothetical protein